MRVRKTEESEVSFLCFFCVPGRAHSLGGGSPLQARQGELLAGRQGYSP
jgi:hypothetical protein